MPSSKNPSRRPDAPAAEDPLLRLGAADDELSEVLAQASLLVLKHPAAAQALLHALIREGRRFGATEQGRRWREVLAGSEFVQRGRALWDATNLKLIEDDPETLLPTAVIDAIAQVLGRGDLQELLMAIQMREFTGAADRS